MTVTIVTKEGKVKVFNDDGKRTAGEQLFNWSVKNKPEWWHTKKPRKK